MFRLLRRFAFRPAPSARAQALASLRRNDFAAAERLLTLLLDDVGAPTLAPSAERAFLLNKRGVARVAMARTQLGRADFAAALLCAANYAPALTNLANLLLEEGDVEGAIARYEGAILADPDYAIAHLNLGVALKRAGRVEEAVRALRRAQRLDKPTFLRRRRPS